MTGDFHPVLQIGLFIDFPYLLGPALILGGSILLIHWNIQNHYLPEADSWGVRVGLATIFVSGMLLTTIGYIVRYEIVWAVSLTLFSLGRIIEGAVFVRLVRKLVHYSLIVISFLTSVSYESTSDKSFVSKIVSKMKFRVISLVIVVVATVLVIATGVLSEGTSYSYALLYGYTVFVASSVGVSLIYDLRDIVDDIEFSPFVSLILCVAGAEVFRYPEGEYQLSWLIPFSEQQIGFLSGLPGFNKWTAATFLFGQVMLVLGIVISLVFLFFGSSNKDTRDRSRTI